MDVLTSRGERPLLFPSPHHPGGLPCPALQDLNADPKMPYADNSFDIVTNCVSVDYLTQPLEVGAGSMQRVHCGVDARHIHHACGMHV